MALNTQEKRIRGPKKSPSHKKRNKQNASDTPRVVFLNFPDDQEQTALKRKAKPSDFNDDVGSVFENISINQSSAVNSKENHAKPKSSISRSKSLPVNNSASRLFVTNSMNKKKRKKPGKKAGHKKRSEPKETNSNDSEPPQIVKKPQKKKQEKPVAKKAEHAQAPDEGGEDACNCYAANPWAAWQYYLSSMCNSRVNEALCRLTSILRRRNSCNGGQRRNCCNGGNGAHCCDGGHGAHSQCAKCIQPKPPPPPTFVFAPSVMPPPSPVVLPPPPPPPPMLPPHNIYSPCIQPCAISAKSQYTRQLLSQPNAVPELTQRVLASLASDFIRHMYANIADPHEQAQLTRQLQRNLGHILIYDCL